MTPYYQETWVEAMERLMKERDAAREEAAEFRAALQSLVDATSQAYPDEFDAAFDEAQRLLEQPGEGSL